MFKIKIKIRQIIFLTVIYLSAFSVVLAQSSNSNFINGLPKLPGADPSTIDSVGSFIEYAFQLSLYIVGIAVFINLIYGGAMYLYGAAVPSKKAEAKAKIYNSILGMLLLLSAWLILNTINPDLVKNTFTLPGL